MLSNRQKLILKAIVEEYVKAVEPIGSKFLIDKPYLEFSSATIRFEMAKLEELGFLEKTHISSGRVPSEKGYKYYVENLFTRDDRIEADFPAIDALFSKKELSKEETIKEALNLLSDLTNYTTVALGPNFQNCRIKKIEFIPLSRNEAILLIVTNLGHVENQKIRLSEDFSLNDLKKIIQNLDELLHDVPLAKAQEIINHKLADTQIKNYMDYQETLINSFLNTFEKFMENSFFLSGVSKAFLQPEFQSVEKLRGFMEIMDEKNVLKVMRDFPESLSVRIGGENQFIRMNDCTVVSVPYRITEDDYGTIAVIGPTRMEYKKVIPLIEYLAKSMTKLFDE